MTEEENHQYDEDEDRKKPIGKILLFVFLGLFIILSGFLFFKYRSDNMNAEGKSYKSLYEEIKAKNIEEKAELNKQLDDIKLQLDQALEKNSSYLADNASLKDQLDAKTLEIAQKIRSGGIGNPKALREAQAEIERLKSLQIVFETQRDSLTQSNRELIERVLATESNYNIASSKARALEEQKKIIDDKIHSSTLSVADLRVVGIRTKGTTEEETFKASRTGKLKITFTLLENQLVDPGDKEITIRIIGTTKEVLTDDNPSLTDTDKLSTMKETVNYQNEQQKVSVSYSQKASFKKGAYSIELIHNDKLMGRASFILK